MMDSFPKYAALKVLSLRHSFCENQTRARIFKLLGLILIS